MDSADVKETEQTESKVTNCEDARHDNVKTRLPENTANHPDNYNADKYSLKTTRERAFRKAGKADNGKAKCSIKATASIQQSPFLPRGRVGHSAPRSLSNSYRLSYGIKNPPFLDYLSNFVEKKTNFKHSSIVIGVALMLTLCLLPNDLAGLSSQLLCYVYPIYVSAILMFEIPIPQRQASMWMVYWLTCLLFVSFELGMSKSDLHRIIYLSRTVILLFFLYPESRGSQILYEKITGPLFDR